MIESVKASNSQNCFFSCSTNKPKLADILFSSALVISGIALATFAFMAAAANSSYLLVISLSSGAATLIVSAIYHLVRPVGQSKVNHKIGKSPQTSYTKLPTKEELEKISYIFSSLGSASVSFLGWNRKVLLDAGRQLREVHPLRFLSSAISNEKLKPELAKLKKRSGLSHGYVWDEFFKENVAKLERQLNNNNLICYIDKFAADVKLDKAKIHSFVKDKRWKDFFEYIF